VAAHIRPYRPSDLDALYEICLRTGDAGGDASHVVDDTRLLGDIYAGPYAELEPEHALVVDDGTGTAAGYVLAALDTRAFEDACEREWWPAVRARRPERPDGRSFDDLLVALIHHPHRQDADVVATHPSHLHIDLLPHLQGAGWGRRLVEQVTDLLRAGGSRGLHLGVSVRNKRAIGFYQHLGFTELRADSITRTMGIPL
jgi:ribosomal protein S18 acetylase RimI-like enzyme